MWSAIQEESGVSQMFKSLCKARLVLKDNFRRGQTYGHACRQDVRVEGVMVYLLVNHLSRNQHMLFLDASLVRHVGWQKMSLFSLVADVVVVNGHVLDARFLIELSGN